MYIKYFRGRYSALIRHWSGIYPLKQGNFTGWQGESLLSEWQHVLHVHGNDSAQFEALGTTQTHCSKMPLKIILLWINIAMPIVCSLILMCEHCLQSCTPAPAAAAWSSGLAGLQSWFPRMGSWSLKSVSGCEWTALPSGGNVPWCPNNNTHTNKYKQKQYFQLFFYCLEFPVYRRCKYGAQQL